MGRVIALGDATSSNCYALDGIHGSQTGTRDDTGGRIGSSCSKISVDCSTTSGDSSLTFVQQQGLVETLMQA